MQTAAVQKTKNGIDFAENERKATEKSVLSQVSFCFVCRRLGLTFFGKPPMTS